MKLHVGKSNRKDGQSTTTYSITERKTSIYFFSMSDEESRSVRKRMWKITSGVFIVFFLRIELRRPYNKQLINLVRLVITGKSQTSALMYSDLVIVRSIDQALGLRFPCNALTLG